MTTTAMNTTNTSVEAALWRAGSTTPIGTLASPLASNAVVRNSRFPEFIRADQAYYWSSAWQRDEAQSLAALKAGNSQTFTDPLDAVRYLLSDG